MWEDLSIVLPDKTGLKASISLGKLSFYAQLILSLSQRVAANCVKMYTEFVIYIVFQRTT